jgi:hypothetical protein
MSRNPSDIEPKCRQNRLFERTQAALVFIQSDIAASQRSDQRGPAWQYKVHLDKTGHVIK